MTTSRFRDSRSIVDACQTCPARHFSRGKVSWLPTHPKVGWAESFKDPAQHPRVITSLFTWCCIEFELIIKDQCSKHKAEINWQRLGSRHASACTGATANPPFGILSSPGMTSTILSDMTFHCFSQYAAYRTSTSNCAQIATPAKADQIPSKHPFSQGFRRISTPASPSHFSWRRHPQKRDDDAWMLKLRS